MRRRSLGYEVAVASLYERMEHLDHHAVEMAEGEHIDNAVAGLQECEMVDAIADVAP